MKMMGIIFSNIYDEYLGQLTKERTLASLPFGGRYRIIDFVLSNMVNSDITNVGVITKSNYQSLMDHLGNGEEWDLSRKIDGLFILPPFGVGQKNIYEGKIEALWGATKYLERSTQEYVVITDTHVICNIDYSMVLKRHIETKADITMITKKEEIVDKLDLKEIVVKLQDDKVVDVLTNYNVPGNVVCTGIGGYILKRELLLKLIYEAMSYNRVDFEKDIIQKKYEQLNIRSYEFEGEIKRIINVSQYFKANMALLDRTFRNEIFTKERPIFTKIRDEVPTQYQDHGLVVNSLIADGCVIDGKVENSILFRGVKIAKGAVVKNCILMQDTEVGESANINYVISDKDVKVTDGKNLMGADDYPIIMHKGVIV